MGKYVTYDYEDPATPPYWHIYDVGAAPILGDVAITIEGPDTPEMQQKVAAICSAIDDAIDMAMKKTA